MKRFDRVTLFLAICLGVIYIAWITLYIAWITLFGPTTQSGQIPHERNDALWETLLKQQFDSLYFENTKLKKENKELNIELNAICD